MNKLNYIHCRDGQILSDTDTSLESLDQIIGKLAQNDDHHLIVHFHGGLVNKSTALDSSKDLIKHFINGYAVFFIWESGPVETIVNNLEELLDEPVFEQLLLKIIAYVVDNGRSKTADKLSIKSSLPNEKEILENIESDKKFISELQSLPLENHPFIQSRGAGIKIYSSDFSHAFSQDFFSHPKNRSLSGLLGIAHLLLKVILNIHRRFEDKRDHGWATIAEELVRCLKLAGSGLNEWGKTLEWNPMKQDIQDAFGPNPDQHAATAFLSRINQAIESERLILKKITFVGHSAGCIYLHYWLAKCAEYTHLADIKQDVIFWAPATTYYEFAQTLSRSKNQIAHFRMFSMSDDWELKDQLIPGETDWKKYIYPSSLLYLVSGILESRLDSQGELVDLPDEPLLGMQRFFLGDQFNEMSEVEQVRRWLTSEQNRLVWSKTASDSPKGMRCSCDDHGQFGTDPETLDSLVHILGSGF